MSYATALSADLQHRDDPVAPGDIVATTANLFPHYRVIAVDNGMAWVRNVDNGQDALASLSRCRIVTPAAKAA